MQQCHLTQGSGCAHRVSPYFCSDTTLYTSVSSKYMSYTERRAAVIIIRVIHLSPCAVSPWCAAFSVSVGISALIFPALHSCSQCSALPSVCCPVCKPVHAVDRLNIGKSPLGISMTHPPPLDLQTEAQHECPVQNCLVPGSSKTWGKEFLQALYHSAVALLWLL